MIYIGLYIGWGLSVSHRILQNTSAPLYDWRFISDRFLVCCTVS